MDLNPAHVRTLAAVAREGSFSRAAQCLHLSQPAVSLHVRALEERLGVAMLARRRRRPVLTRAGTVLLAHAGRAFAELAAAERAVRALRGVIGGPVRLGTGATAASTFCPIASARCAGATRTWSWPSSPATPRRSSPRSPRATSTRES
jgi:DNA-binding transcriptional LysR family regulator